MLDVFLELANEAGSIIREFYERGNYETRLKNDNSPVTTADFKANEKIVSGLRKKFPKIPIISEEEKNKNLKSDDFFLVDPLDGTKEFLKGSMQFTVNIAFIKNFRPAMGVIYSPITGEMFFSDHNNKAFCQNNLRGSKKLLLDGKHKKQKIYRVLTSKSHIDKETETLLKLPQEYQIIRMGSSIKFCLLAKGEADFYPRSGTTMEWDTAAGHAILNAAGGKLIDLTTKQEVAYGKRNFKNNPFVAHCGGAYDSKVL